MIPTKIKTPYWELVELTLDLVFLDPSTCL